MLFVWPVVDIPLDDLDTVVRRLASHTEGLGIEQVVVEGRLNAGDGEPADVVMRLGYETGKGLTMRFTEPPTVPMEPLDDYNQKAIAARRRGMVYPYELIHLLAGEGGSFVEHDLDESGALVPVDRPWGGNRAGIVVGVASSPTTWYPEGVRRVVLLGDSSKAMGSIAEPECRRLLARVNRARRVDGRADRVVRPVGRSQDRHGLRLGEPRLGTPASCAAWWSTPRPGSRSTSSSPA